MKKVLISLFDYTGNWSRPYVEAGWHVIKIDIKMNRDILLWDYKSELANVEREALGILAAVPCTDYAVSGARHFAMKDVDGRTAKSQLLVAKTKEIIDYFNPDFCAIENPMSRIHSLNQWMGKPVLKFDPCDYAGYDPQPDLSRYNKKTWLWGKFNIPEKRRLEPLQHENPGWKSLGGKSEKTKELRSITPMGFSYAFYAANH